MVNVDIFKFKGTIIEIWSWHVNIVFKFVYGSDYMLNFVSSNLIMLEGINYISVMKKKMLLNDLDSKTLACFQRG